ncbi:MAG: hypothetical protein AAF513_20650, partial [Pseudomonadota bacterium]
MIDMLQCRFNGYEIKLVGSDYSGKEELYIDDELVAQRRNLFSTRSHFSFQLPSGEAYELHTHLAMGTLLTTYKILQHQQVVQRGEYQAESTTVNKIIAWGENRPAEDARPPEPVSQGPKPW